MVIFLSSLFYCGVIKCVEPNSIIIQKYKTYRSFQLYEMCFQRVYVKNTWLVGVKILQQHNRWLMDNPWGIILANRQARLTVTSGYWEKKRTKFKRDGVYMISHDMRWISYVTLLGKTTFRCKSRKNVFVRSRSAHF